MCHEKGLVHRRVEGVKVKSSLCCLSPEGKLEDTQKQPTDNNYRGLTSIHNVASREKCNLSSKKLYLKMDFWEVACSFS